MVEYLAKCSVLNCQWKVWLLPTKASRKLVAALRMGDLTKCARRFRGMCSTFLWVCTAPHASSTRNDLYPLLSSDEEGGADSGDDAQEWSKSVLRAQRGELS